MGIAISRNCRRVILKRGDEYIIFKTDNIAYLFLENKICYLVDTRSGFHYRISGTLRDIYETLDPGEFYRVNKNYIVNIRSIVSLKVYDLHKVELMLEPAARENVYISQLRIGAFREWIEKKYVDLNS